MTMPKTSAATARFTLPQFSSLFIDNSRDAVITIDLGGRIAGWNKAAEDLFGYSKAEILKEPVTILFPPELPGEQLVRRGNLTSTRPVVDWNTQQIGKDGSKFSSCVSISPVFDKAGKVTARCVIARENRAASGIEGDMQQLQKLEAVGRLAGGIAHDFNNLLTVIAGYNSMLRSSLPADSPLVAYATEVEQAADRAASLTRQLLVFSRRAVTSPEVVNLNLASKDLENMLRRILGPGVKLEFNLSSELRDIKADPGQIGQMLMTLAVNARDAMPQGGVLHIATANVDVAAPPGAPPYLEPTREPGAYVEIAISDNGAGMDPYTREHIFEPFFTTKTRGKGRGLGLSIVHGIVSRMRGSIDVETELGKGSTFRVSFPANHEDDEKPARPVENIAEPAQPFFKTTVLLVEDEDGVRHLVKDMLLNAGYAVHDVATSEEAIELNGIFEYDLLLTDVAMPAMQGGDLAMRLQETRPTLRVLYMSGYMDESLPSDRFLKAGGKFLQKPFTAEELANQVKRALQVPRTASVST
jgi:hypothetical protein